MRDIFLLIACDEGGGGVRVESEIAAEGFMYSCIWACGGCTVLTRGAVRDPLCAARRGGAAHGGGCGGESIGGRGCASSLLCWC